MLAPRQRLEQDVLLGGEVVHHLPGAHPGPAGDLGQAHPVDADLRDELERGLQDTVTASLPVGCAARPAAPGRWRGHARGGVP